MVTPEAASLATVSTRRPVMSSFGTMEPTIMKTFERELVWSNKNKVTKMSSEGA